MAREYLSDDTLGVRSVGAAMIFHERLRQIDDEGWTAEHDDDHVDGELARAAASYALIDLRPSTNWLLELWPWGDGCWKPSDDPIRNLVMAGALIAAEIDRLQRLKEAKNTGD